MTDLQKILGKQKGTATEIIEIFEDLLEKHGITIPDDGRTGAEGEAPIYGVTYGDLRDDIELILADYINE